MEILRRIIKFIPLGLWKFIGIVIAVGLVTLSSMWYIARVVRLDWDDKHEVLKSILQFLAFAFIVAFFLLAARYVGYVHHHYTYIY